jgi:hypothetical protein
MLYRTALLTLACAALGAGCSEQQPNAADQQPQAQQPAPASGPVLPITDNAAAEAAEPANAAAPDAAETRTAIPAALHGRWGLTRGDCAAKDGTDLGLVVLTPDEVRFYESTAKPSKIIERTDSRIRGEFDFVGEGGTWTNHMIWSADGNKLTRVDSEEDSRQVYTRC